MSAIDDGVRRARTTHERFIAALGLATAVAGIVVVLWRIQTVEAESGRSIVAFVLGASLVFAVSLFDPRPLAIWKMWARPTFEVSCVTAVMLFDLAAGPLYLVTSSTASIYLLAVTLSCLRLRPVLCLYAAGLACVQQVGVYWLAFAKIKAMGVYSAELPMPRLQQELLFRLLVTMLVGAVGFMLARTLLREIRAAAEEARVRSAFGSYVDVRVVRRILAGDLAIAPERREITVMFVDIRGFTRIAEETDAALLLERLNGALDAFSTQVQRQGGMVNKFLGDGLMAIFGAPESQPDHARRAVRAAIEIVEAAIGQAADGRFPGLDVGIGIHSGEAVIGDVGGERREYTAIGDVVNVASRVESANREFGSRILVTGAVIQHVAEDVDAVRHPAVTLRGRVSAEDLYEITQMRRRPLTVP